MPNEYDSDHDRQGPGGEQEEENRRKREEQAQKLNQELGIDGGNLESFLSGRNSYEGYLADQRARTTNTPGDENGDGVDDRPRQGPSTSGGGGSSSGGGGGSSNAPAYAGPTQITVNPFPDWYKEMMTRENARQEAERAETKAKADTLYATLSTRANQGTAIDRNDPIIRAQADAFSANQIRARRNYLSDTAERRGPLANIQGERRVTAEKVGQSTGAFEASLLQQELTAKRAEIATALATQGQILSAEQTRDLQSKLAVMDQAIKEASTNNTSRGLDLTDKGLNNSFALGQGDLDLRKMLGLGDLDLRKLGLTQQNDQFLRQLGFNDWDKQMYYDLVQRGVL